MLGPTRIGRRRKEEVASAASNDCYNSAFLLKRLSIVASIARMRIVELTTAPEAGSGRMVVVKELEGRDALGVEEGKDAQDAIVGTDPRAHDVDRRKPVPTSANYSRSPDLGCCYRSGRSRGSLFYVRPFEHKAIARG